MAEARSAVSYRVEKTNLLFQISDEEIVLRINRNVLPVTLNHWKRSISRKLNRIKNGFFNAIYPAPPLQWGILIATPALIMSSTLPRIQFLSSSLWKLVPYIPFNHDLTRPSQIAIISTTVGTSLILFSSLLRRFMLRALLGYQGWLYDEVKKRSIKTTIWGVMVHFVTGNYMWKFSPTKPLLYSNQSALPRLPVPALDSTCQKYLHSVRPLLNDEEYAEMERLVHDFKAKEGNKLQFYLIIKSWFSSNYVSDWWEKYVYLRGRSPITINSNYYILDTGLPKPPTPHQVARTARIISDILAFKSLLDRETLPPMVIRGTVPMCMSQYERMFGTTRIPRKEFDTLEQFDSTYVVIIRKGIFYVVEVYHFDGTPLTPCELEVQIKWIMQDAEKDAPTESESCIPSLTTENRSTWANAREEFFSSGINKISLDTIEQALFVVYLEHEVLGEDYTTLGRSLFHGNGKNRWSDKSFTMTVFPHAKAGVHVEHSWADAPVLSHMWEYALIIGDETKFDENGWNIKTGHNKPRSPPYRLRWDLSPKVEKVIETAMTNLKKMIDDCDHLIVTHDQFGKGLIKKCGVSPDAFIQLAMQLAYHRDAGHFGLTYESSMTRLFRNGRTETVRPCSMDSLHFVNSMNDPTVSKERRIELLKIASETHQQAYRDCMTGKGIDRHLFALYVVSQGMELKSNFLEKALSMEWKLSTSQQPQGQTDLWNPNKNKQEADKVSPGGGFGPVSDDGYGVSYMVAGEYKLFFHISSKKSSSKTDSTRFKNHLIQALKELKELFFEDK